MQNYVYPSSSDVTLTGSTNGAPIPPTSIVVGGENASGNVAPLQLTNSGALIVTPIAGSLTNVNLTEVGGAAFSLGQQLASASLPVVLTAAQLSTLTPLTTVAVTQSGTWNLNNISGTISLPTGAATAANQTNASQKTQIVDGSGNVIASTTNALNVDVINFPATQPVSGTVAATQSGTWNINNVSGTVSLPTGAATSANQATEITSLSTIATNTTGLNNTITTTGSAVPTEALQIGVKSGSSLVALTEGSATSANSIPVVIASDQGSVSVKAGTGTLTDGSGSTSATPSTSTQIFASNSTRKYLLIQNLDTTNSIYINFTSAASNGTGSYTLGPLGSIVQESTYVSTEAINVLATVASVKFTAKQG